MAVALTNLFDALLLLLSGWFLGIIVRFVL
jgi:hypothetical protein